MLQVLAVARAPNLLNDPVGPAVLRLTLPTLGGLAAIIFFGVVDTYWVSRLGDDALAAMGYTFPVTAVVLNIAIGFGIGTTSAIARAIGTGERERVIRLTTHALLLAVASVALVVGVGLATMSVLFPAMGADAATTVLIERYMRPWYWGVCFLVVPMVGNSAIRATGDTLTPSLIMALAGLLNAGLTPLLVFGWGPLPRLELEGAAYATVISWVVTFSASTGVLYVRERALSLSALRSLSSILSSFRQVLHVGLPAASANLLFPVADGVLTSLIARWGNDAVAAFGVATRVEQVAMIGVFALSTSLSPVVGQNAGARRYDRVRETTRFVIRIALLWGATVALSLWAFGEPLAYLFSETDSVAEVLVSFWRYVPISYGLLGVAVLSNTALNALRAPGWSMFLTLVRLFALLLPLAVLGGLLGELPGMFLGISIALGTGGLIARWIALRFIDLLQQETPAVAGRPSPAPVAE